MKSFFKFGEKNSEKPGKLAIVFLLVLMIFSFLVIQPVPVNAQGAPVFDSMNAALKAGDSVWQKITNSFKYLWQKGGSMAFQQTLRTVLNKVAVDTANYVGSGGEGQKPLFISDPWSYVANVGDEAAGAYLENFANNLTVSSNCEADKKTCFDQCSGSDSECTAKCDGICDTCANKKKLCTDKCNTDYSASVKELANIDKSQAKEFSASARTGCYQSCNNVVCKDSSGLLSNSASSLATPAFNICQPSSIDAKLKITLGLAEQNRTQGADCKATDIVKNWGDLDNYGNSVKALKDLYNSTQGGYDDQLFLNDIKGIFSPTGNDMGIYLSAKADSAAKVDVNAKAATNILVGKGGWLDAQLINGGSKSLPNQAEINAKGNYDQYAKSFGTYTGDAFVDALNTFLSQTAFTAFNTLMKNLGKTAAQGSLTTNSQDFSDPNSNPSLGEGAVKEASSKLSQPDFSSPANFDILSQLSICQNADNPGPTDCVIDNKFMQAVAEHKTVIEAVKDGSLNGSWRLTSDSVSDAYTLRNISILRKYLILPVGWEVAISEATRLGKGNVTLNDLLSCFDAKGSYKKFSSGFDQVNPEWCRGLVDPNWVLKAPLNYCSKQGAGGQILNFTVNAGYKGINGQPDTLSTYDVTRADDYCADSQTCIKEKSNGSCDAYGYCSEEKRTWDFGFDSCQPVNNTCRNFNGGATSKSVSYLENTLDYSNCNAASAGCREYSLMGDYVNGSVRWGTDQRMYFNGSASFSTCSQSQEGCTGLLRVKTSGGTNLIINSDFSADKTGDTNIKGPLNAWPIYGEGSSWQATMVDAQSDPIANSKSLKLEATGSAGSKTMVAVFSDDNNLLVPSNLQIISGQAYTLSADVYLVEGDMIQANIGYDDNIVYSQISTKNSWQRISVTRSPKDSFNKPAFFVGAYGAGGQVTAYIKNIKFEASNTSNGYTAYGTSRIYEKLLPNYLEKSCYVDPISASKNYSLKDDAPSVCKNYARKCNREEVGCELYSSDTNKFSVAAQVNSSDLCPKECLNYDVYISRLNSFNVAQRENLIPSTAKKCSVEEVGCNEFTNLDSLNQGGETREYYTELKQCIKPSTIDCGSYYAWEGTENGYQLKSYSLKKGNSGPAVTSDDVVQCNSIVYHSALSSPSYNSDCLEFYDAAGQVSYHLLAKTITCSDNCHAYRLTEKNLDLSISQASQCTGIDKNWDAQNLACQVCLNGGIYDSNQKACVYQAIPSEGKTCQASAKDCREYNGSNGENIRLISASDFEGANNWSSNCANGLSRSAIANTNNGHSLKYNNNAGSCQAIGESVQTSIARSPLIKQILASDGVAAQLKVGQSVQKGFAYSVSFIARATTDTSLKIYLYNKETQQKSYFNSASEVKVNGGNEWQIYRANLDSLDHTVSNNEVLVISANNDFYFDNFILNEISEKYYLIKNSSVIPDSCYYDNFAVYQGSDYNLGCRQYSDRAKVQHNLRQFSKLCAESGVGCEQMIDTKNYSPGGPGVWNDTNKNKKCDSDEPDCVSVPGDSAVYAVYDSSKLCNVSDAGCSLLGQGTKVGAVNTWSDVFKRNNPDNYSSTLCKQASVGCEKWTDDGGSAYYFKDPADNTCVYKTLSGSSIKAWYKSPVKRCDKNKTGQIEGMEINSAICVKDADCGSGNTCIADNNGYPCSTSVLKTLGFGGVGNQVPIPNQAVGLCDAKESTCTEYIDPVSAFVPNLVSNPDYQLIGGVRDGWAGDTRKLMLDSNKLYIFNVESAVQGSGETKLSFSLDVKTILNNNILGVSTREITIGDGGGQPQLFYTFGPTEVTISGAKTGKTIVLKPAIIDYQLKNNLDTVTNTCNGLVNSDQGCVLFNERSVKNIDGVNGFNSLINNAYATGVGSSPANCDTTSNGACNANKLIQVKPNRICSKWLSCVTYVKDEKGNQTCYALGECDRLSEDNKTCADFLDTSNTSARVFDPKVNKDSSGYSLMGKYYFGRMKEVGLNSDFHYNFEDLVPSLSCVRDSSAGGNCNFANNKNLAKELLVREKVGAPTDYPANGKSYLKVISGYLISPQIAGSGVSLLPNRDYYLSFLINTHNSGVAGKVYIKSKDSLLSNDKFTTVFTSDAVSANSGWERKILKFHTKDEAVDSKNIYRVELGSDTSDKDGNVYFDDLNIEPVLETAPSQYVARECRLYPEATSLTCNDSLTKDGFEGYCLEHDLKNPAVCSLWYPVDHINSANTGKATAGYNGLAPLSYCTQVNGQFALVEKRSGAMLAFAGGHTDIGDLISRVTSDGSGGVNAPLGCEKGININESCTCLDDATSFKICGSSDYSAVYGENGYDNKQLLVYCVPKQSSILLGTQKSVSFSKYDSIDKCIISFKVGWAPYNGLFYKDFKFSTAHGIAIETSLMENLTENVENPVRVYDYSNPPGSEENLKLVSGSDPERNFRLTCDSFSQVVNSNGNNVAWSDRVSSKSLYPITTPLYFLQTNGEWYGGNLSLVEKRVGAKIFGADGNNGGSGVEGCTKTNNRCKTGIDDGTVFNDVNYVEWISYYHDYGGTWPNDRRNFTKILCVPDQSKLLPGTTKSVTVTDMDKCNGEKYNVGWGVYDGPSSFTGTCTGTGCGNIDESKNFVDGLATTSPLYQVTPLIYNYDKVPATEKDLKSYANIDSYAISRYGRNRENTPFGAAVLPTDIDLLSSEAIKLRDQYSAKQKEDVFAGRPYGCSGSGCASIGSCSLNPDVYCLVDPVSISPNFNLNKKTCGDGGYGVCIPLWYKPLSNHSVILPDYKQILKNLFLKEYSSYSYDGSSYAADLDTPFDFTPKTQCSSNPRIDSSLSSFCPIYPKVTHVNLKLNGASLGSASPYDLPQRGIYSLEFNSEIDKEQQPLKEIYIDWGDGSDQVITGQDARPSGLTPHSFYHYYNQSGPKNIQIKVTDNWGFYGVK